MGAWESDRLAHNLSPLIRHMALRMLFHLSTPRFLHLYSGPNNGDCCEDRETIYKLPSTVSDTQSVLSISGNDYYHYRIVIHSIIRTSETPERARSISTINYG